MFFELAFLVSPHESFVGANEEHDRRTRLVNDPGAD
jgi:hypothetical protein